MRIRYSMEKVTKGKSFVKPERLPPTKALKYSEHTFKHKNVCDQKRN